MARALRARPAVVDDAFLRDLRAALAGTGPALLPLGADPALAARVTAALRPDLPLEDDDVALVVPTSGSTGEPKGVLLPAQALAASGAAAAERLGGPAAWLLALPATHVGGLQVVLRGLDTALVVAGPGEALADAAARLPGGRRCTSLVPTQLRRLLADPREAAALASFDAVLVGAAATPAALLGQARAAGVRVVTTYGMSETSGGCVYDGVPLPGVEVGGVPAAGPGTVTLTGEVVARGYRLRPDLTARAFAGRTFRTSDVGRLVDGRLVVLGRADDVVVTGGEKVVPGEVEAVLAAHPAVVDVAVVGVPDEEWGARVVAVAVLREPLTLEQARDHVGARLGRVAAPRELRVVEALPLLPSGKPDRARLRSTP